MKIRIILFLSLLLLLGTSCSKDRLKMETIAVRTVYVNSELTYGYDMTGYIVRPYLQAKFESDAPSWFSLSGVEGFVYEEGYFYTLKVLEITVDKPLMEDEYSITYDLLEVISKTKDTSADNVE